MRLASQQGAHVIVAEVSRMKRKWWLGLPLVAMLGLGLLVGRGVTGRATGGEVEDIGGGCGGDEAGDPTAQHESALCASGDCTGGDPSQTCNRTLNCSADNMCPGNLVCCRDDGKCIDPNNSACLCGSSGGASYSSCSACSYCYKWCTSVTTGQRCKLGCCSNNYAAAATSCYTP
jgi:hypothetical protein